MLRKILLSVTILSFFAAGCKQRSNEARESDAKEQQPDSTAVAADLDPDPTDTIPAGGYEAHTDDAAVAEKLRKVLPGVLKQELVGADSSARRFVYYETDLNEDGAGELLVGFTGMNWCGSGGCTALLLSANGELITRFTVVDFPFKILGQKTKGWKDLVVYSGGADRLLQFDGKGYPRNPSVAPKFTGKLPESLPLALAFTTKPYPWYTF